MSITRSSIQAGTAAPALRGGRSLSRGLAFALLAAVPAVLRGQASPQSPVAARPAGAQIAAYPAIVHLNADAAEQTTAVTVRNDGKAPAQLRFYLGDFDQNENGDFTFLPYGKGPSSCQSKLTSFPDGTVLDAGEQQQVQLNMAAGAGVCWTLLFIETLPQGSATGFKVVQRIGVRVTNAPPQATSAGEVSAVTVRPPKRDTVAVRFTFQNTGQAPLDLRGRVEIRDYSGKQPS